MIGRPLRARRHPGEVQPEVLFGGRRSSAGELRRVGAVMLRKRIRMSARVQFCARRKPRADSPCVEPGTLRPCPSGAGTWIRARARAGAPGRATVRGLLDSPRRGGVGRFARVSVDRAHYPTRSARCSSRPRFLSRRELPEPVAGTGEPPPELAICQCAFVHELVVEDARACARRSRATTRCARWDCAPTPTRRDEPATATCTARCADRQRAAREEGEGEGGTRRGGRRSPTWRPGPRGDRAPSTAV